MCQSSKDILYFSLRVYVLKTVNPSFQLWSRINSMEVKMPGTTLWKSRCQPQRGHHDSQRQLTVSHDIHSLKNRRSILHGRGGSKGKLVIKTVVLEPGSHRRILPGWVSIMRSVEAADVKGMAFLSYSSPQHHRGTRRSLRLWIFGIPWCGRHVS